MKKTKKKKKNNLNKNRLIPATRWKMKKILSTNK